MDSDTRLKGDIAKKILKIVFALIYLIVILTIGTKTPLLTLLLTIGFSYLYYIIYCIKKKTYKYIRTMDKKYLDEIKKEWEEKNVLLVTHKSTLRIINTYFNELLNNEIYEFNPKNSEVLLYGKIFE